MSYQNFQAIAPLMIPIVALFIPIVLFVAHYLAKASSDRQRYETIRELVRAGQPIPPELLGDAHDSDWHRARRKQAKPNHVLIAALINISAGLGVMGMFAAMMPGAWLWSIGLLPLFFGLGLALYWAVERKERLQQLQQPQQP
jgi:Domain of unknown function (DUF6249)